MKAKEEFRHESNGLVQRCSAIIKFRQAENRASNRMFKNAFSVDVMIVAWGRKFVNCSVDNRFATRLGT